MKSPKGTEYKLLEIVVSNLSSENDKVYLWKVISALIGLVTTLKIQIITKNCRHMMSIAGIHKIETRVTVSYFGSMVAFDKSDNTVLFVPDEYFAHYTHGKTEKTREIISFLLGPSFL